MSDINPIEDHPAGQSTLGLQLYLVKMLAITPFDDPIKSYMEDHRQAFDAHLEWLGLKHPQQLEMGHHSPHAFASIQDGGIGVLKQGVHAKHSVVPRGSTLAAQ